MFALFDTKPELAFALVIVAAGCGTSESTAPAEPSAVAPVGGPAVTSAAAEVAAQPEPIPSPHGDPDAGHDPGMRTAEGQIDLTIDGRPQSIASLPFARNAAVWVADKKIGRVTIGGATDASGLQPFSIALIGYKLDELALPRTLSHETFDDGRQGLLRITWEVDEHTLYKTRDADTREGLNTITLTSWKGGKLTGTFSGKLVRSAGKTAGDGIAIEGSFEVALRVNGVAPDSIVEAATP